MIEKTTFYDMPVIKSAKKALKQSRKKRIFNLRRLKKMRALIKQVRQSVIENKKDEALKLISETYKAIDKAAKRGVIKNNNANRKKSRLAKAIGKIPAPSK